MPKEKEQAYALHYGVRGKDKTFACVNADMMLGFISALLESDDFLLGNTSLYEIKTTGVN